jgi:hypothetical protein
MEWQTGLPPEPGWYVVEADHLASLKVRAFGKDGQWWTALGRGNGEDGWMTSPGGYRWVGPALHVDEDQPSVAEALAILTEQEDNAQDAE